MEPGPYFEETLQLCALSENVVTSKFQARRVRHAGDTIDWVHLRVIFPSVGELLSLCCHRTVVRGEPYLCPVKDETN